MGSNHTHNEQGALPARTTLNSLLVKQTVLVQQIAQREMLPVTEKDDITFDGTVYEALLHERSAKIFTNFSPDTLEDLYQTMQPFIADAGTRGPKTKSSWMDQLVLYLIWSKLGEDYQVLGKTFHIKQNHFQQNLDRIHPLINKTLRFR
jgi:hypothetical protein